MKVFIVHAHPEPRWFSAAMKKAAVEELERPGHQVVVSDLYAIQFTAAASIADFTERANPDYCVYALEQGQHVIGRLIEHWASSATSKRHYLCTQLVCSMTLLSADGSKQMSRIVRS